MSGLQSITYQTIVDAVKTYIKTNCANITNFAGIPNVFKNGYSNKITISGGNAAATCYCTVTLSANEISQATTTDVDNDMTAFLQSIIPVAVLSQPITDSELIKFINDMTIFCSARMTYSTSIYNTGTSYLVYNKAQTPSDFSWEYEDDSSTSRQVYNHLKEDIGYSETFYYKCTSKESGDIIYTTKTDFTPENIDMTTYDYLMDYITQHGVLPSGAEVTDQNISDEYVVMTGLSPLVYDISDYTYTYNNSTFTPLSETESSAYLGEILYDEEHFVIDPNDFIKVVSYSVTPTTETIGSYTITYYPAQDGHKIVLPNMEQTVLNIWNESHVCTYYVLDVNNRRFKYPIGINPESYDDIELISSHGHADKQIDLTDATSIINAVVNITKKSIRCVPVQYSENYS